MSEHHHIFYITPSQAGERLDKFLNAHVPNLTRTRLKALIESNQVLLGEAPHLKGLFCQEKEEDPIEDITLSLELDLATIRTQSAVSWYLLIMYVSCTAHMYSHTAM